MKKGIKKALLIFGLAAFLLIVLFFAVRAVGVYKNKSIPSNGYNKTAYVDVNGTKEWISIYSKNKKNPVLLVLHGGPGIAQSAYAYKYQREWGEKYTVVTWDQRGSGLSKDTGLKAGEMSMDLILSDTLSIVNYLRSNLGVDKVTILGYSWGTMLGAKLAYEYPQYFDAFISAGQVVDTRENEEEFVKVAKKWVENDSEGLKMVEKLTPNSLNAQHRLLREEIMKKYGYSDKSNGYGFNYYSAVYFNPYYTIRDFYNDITYDNNLYLPIFNSNEFNNFSIYNQKKYKVPYYFICGDKDYQTNYEVAKKYYDMIEAPKKEYFLIKDCTHGLMTEKTDEFTEILMEIADKKV